MNRDLTTAPAGLPPARESLRGLTRRRLHAGRNASKAAVDLVDDGVRRFVLKDVSERPFLVRRILGPWQLRREARAYRRLAGIPGIPRLLGAIDRQAIAIEFVDGPPLRSLRPGQLGGEFFDRLARLVRAMHERGVAHGDLHHGDVLFGPLGQPYVIDFSTSALIDPARRGWARFLFEQMRHADLRAVEKLRRRLTGDPGTSLPPRRGLYRFGAALRRLFGRR
jgi:serine/threonine protein kinase